MFENNATKNNVKSYETTVIFNTDGDVIFNWSASLKDAFNMRKLDDIAGMLDAPSKMVVTLNGERSSWYIWNGEMFIMMV